MTVCNLGNSETSYGSCSENTNSVNIMHRCGLRIFVSKNAETFRNFEGTIDVIP